MKILRIYLGIHFENTIKHNWHCIFDLQNDVGCSAVDKVNRKKYAKMNMYGKATNRLKELHDKDCPRVNELAVIIDMFVNSLAASESCMKRRTIVKIGYELLSLRDDVQKETRKRMKVEGV